MATDLGLRERKKLQTREAIAEAARRLFVERGFDAVSVVEVARAADVSEATVFNHFQRKEDLVYHRMEDFEGALLRTVRDRPAAEALVDAFGRFVLEPRGYLGSSDPKAPSELAALTRVIADSPSLLAREREIYERYTKALAAVIAKERPAEPDVVAFVIANALVGVHRAIIEDVRRQVLDGVEPATIAKRVRIRGGRALSVLADGIDASRITRSRASAAK
jgi:AcrR family transcriptional regulator